MAEQWFPDSVLLEKDAVEEREWEAEVRVLRRKGLSWLTVIGAPRCALTAETGRSGRGRLYWRFFCGFGLADLATLKKVADWRGHFVFIPASGHRFDSGGDRHGKRSPAKRPHLVLCLVQSRVGADNHAKRLLASLHGIDDSICDIVFLQQMTFLAVSSGDDVMRDADSSATIVTNVSRKDALLCV